MAASQALKANPINAFSIRQNSRAQLALRRVLAGGSSIQTKPDPLEQGLTITYSDVVSLLMLSEQ